MAIGDTVQAGLGRMDFSAFQRAGEAQARANQAFGDAIGGVVEKYYQKKQEKQEREQRERAYREAGLNAELAKAASGDKELGGLLINKMVADRNYQLRKEEFDRQQAMLDEQNADRDRFITMLTSQAPTGKLNEAGQDELERGSLFLAPGPEAQEKFRDELLQNPNLQQTEPVIGMSGNKFLQQFAGESPAVQERALAFMQANAPKPLSPSDQLAREKFDYQKAKDAEEAKPKPPQAPIYMEAAIEAIDDSLKFVEEDSIINPTVGFGSETMANIGGTDAANLQAALSTVTSAIGFKRLQDMREASPTGGALGAVSERELSQLNAALGSISQKQGKPQLKKNLERIKKHYQNSVKAINAQRMAYQQGKSFKSEQEALDFINQQSQGPGIDTNQGTYRIPGLSVEAQ